MLENVNFVSESINYEESNMMFQNSLPNHLQIPKASYPSFT